MRICFEFYGIPFGNHIAKKVIERYINFQYPKYELSIGYISYYFNIENYRGTSYRTNILDKDNDVFTKVNYYWKSNVLSDSRFNQVLDERLDKNIQSIVQEFSPSIIVINSSLSTKVKVNQKFDNDSLKRFDQIYITMQNKEESYILGKEQYIDLVEKILIYIKQNKYQISRIQIHYLDKNYIKNNSYILQLNEEQINLSKEKMIEYITMPSGLIWK